jgi:hypothetical protein
LQIQPLNINPFQTIFNYIPAGRRIWRCHSFQLDVNAFAIDHELGLMKGTQTSSIALATALRSFCNSSAPLDAWRSRLHPLFEDGIDGVSKNMKVKRLVEDSIRSGLRR